MITYTTSKTENDLLQILELQQQNLAVNLNEDQVQSQGFVTVTHRLEDLRKMNTIEQHVIAKHSGRVVAYLLAMTDHAKEDIPVLVPLFKMFDQTWFRNKRINEYKYIVVGQVCVADGFRGRGILDACYDMYKDEFKHKYDFAITEIATRNQRSINAHKRIGFESVKEYTAETGEHWSIVLWNWR